MKMRVKVVITLAVAMALVPLYGRTVAAQSWLLTGDEAMYYGDSKCSGEGSYCIRITQDYIIGLGWVLAMEHYNVSSGNGPHYWVSSYDTSWTTSNAYGTHQNYSLGIPYTGHFLMQDDGNLVLYDDSGFYAGWSTSTAGNSGAYLNVQDDGNLVIYSSGNSPIWSIWA